MSACSGPVEVAPLRPRSGLQGNRLGRRASVSFAGDSVNEETERAALLYGHLSSEPQVVPGSSVVSTKSAAQVPCPEEAFPFRHVDASYYPEPLSEVPRDMHPSQRQDLWDLESSERGIQSDPLMRMRSRASQGQACLVSQAPAGSKQLRTRRLSHGDMLKGKVSNSLLPESGRPLMPTRSSAASRRSSVSGVLPQRDSRDSRPISHRSSFNSAYEEAVSQGYALPSNQGLSRRSWYEGGSTSIADRIAVQAQKSGGAGKTRPPVKHSRSFTNRASHPSPQLPKMGVGVGMIDAPPAKGFRGMLESIFNKS